MCNQSVEVEIPCYKYSKRLKREEERREESRKERRRKEKEESREEKEESREEKRTSSQLSRPPDTSAPGSAEYCWYIPAFGCQVWTHEVGRQFLLFGLFMMGLLEWRNRCKKFQRNIETLLRATGTPRQMSFSTPTWPCPSCLSSQPRRLSGPRSAMSPPSILKPCTYLHVCAKQERPRIARTSHLNS